MSPSLSCTHLELAYLAALLGFDQLTGTPDPFRGLLDEEIGVHLTQAYKSLTEREVVIKALDTSISIAPELADLIRVCATPETAILLTFTRPKNQAIAHNLFQVGAKVVHQSVDSKAQCSELRLLAAPIQPHQVVLEALQFDETAITTDSDHLLTINTFQQVLRCQHDDATICQQLVAGGLEPATAQAFAQALADSPTTASLMVTTRVGDRWETRNILLFQGTGGLWRVRLVPNRPTTIELTRCSLNTALAEATRLVESALVLPV